MANEMQTRLEAKLVPIELDVIGQFLSIMEKQRKFNMVSDLASVFTHKAKEVFSRPWG